MFRICVRVLCFFIHRVESVYNVSRYVTGEDLMYMLEIFLCHDSSHLKSQIKFKGKKDERGFCCVVVHFVEVVQLKRNGKIRNIINSWVYIQIIVIQWVWVLGLPLLRTFFHFSILHVSAVLPISYADFYFLVFCI